MPASLLAAVTLGSALGLWHLSQLSAYLVRTTALESCTQQAEILEVVDNYYSSEVVDRVGKHGIEVTHDYRNRPKSIPLPATLNIELGQRISEKSVSGMQVRLYSDYPFKSRKDGGPKDEFERQSARPCCARSPNGPSTSSKTTRVGLRFASRRLAGWGMPASAATTPTRKASRPIGKLGRLAGCWKSFVPWTRTSPAHVPVYGAHSSSWARSRDPCWRRRAWQFGSGVVGRGR